jgi:predicted membrane GTPase involved in stress response
MHEENGTKKEPIEHVSISVPSGSEGAVIAEL